MSKLKIDFKRRRSTTWELEVRYTAKVNAQYCPCLATFCSSFNEDLAKFKRTNVGHIKNSYKAIQQDGYAEIIWFSPTKDNKVIAVITIAQNLVD